jgi:hypothetical protein
MVQEARFKGKNWAFVLAIRAETAVGQQIN